MNSQYPSQVKILNALTLAILVSGLMSCCSTSIIKDVVVPAANKNACLHCEAVETDHHEDGADEYFGFCIDMIDTLAVFLESKQIEIFDHDRNMVKVTILPRVNFDMTNALERRQKKFADDYSTREETAFFVKYMPTRTATDSIMVLETTVVFDDDEAGHDDAYVCSTVYSGVKKQMRDFFTDLAKIGPLRRGSSTEIRQDGKNLPNGI